jgi:hypothetical protein
MVAMIPIADTLNAASGCNNARLYSPEEMTQTDTAKIGYTMVSIKSIAAHAQIVRSLP